MALTEVAHDDSLFGQGTASSPLGISPIGFTRLDESIDRTFFESRNVPLATVIGDVVTISMSDLQPSSKTPAVYNSVVDADHYMAMITSISGTDCECTTWYIPPTVNGVSKFRWADIAGDIRDNDSLINVLGDKDLFSAAGNNMVKALVKIKSIIGSAVSSSSNNKSYT